MNNILNIKVLSTSLFLAFALAACTADVTGDETDGVSLDDEAQPRRPYPPGPPDARCSEVGKPCVVSADCCTADLVCIVGACEPLEE